MTDQERAKAAFEWLDTYSRAGKEDDWLGSDEYTHCQALLDLLRPIAAGTHVVMPIEPNEVVIDAMRDARRNCSTSRIGGQTIEANYKTEMIVEFSMYAAMIKASQEGE